MACPRVTGKPCDEIAPKDARVDPIRSILMMNCLTPRLYSNEGGKITLDLSNSDLLCKKYQEFLLWGETVIPYSAQ